MKIFHVGLMCVLIGSWSVAFAMKLQVEESQEICSCACQDSLGAWKNVSRK